MIHDWSSNTWQMRNHTRENTRKVSIASKAFDRVQYDRLFNLLVDRK